LVIGTITGYAATTAGMTLTGRCAVLDPLVWLPPGRCGRVDRQRSLVGQVGPISGTDKISLLGEEGRPQHSLIGNEHALNCRPTNSDPPLAISPLEPVDVAAGDELGALGIGADEHHDDVAFGVRSVAVEMTT
jgi:hypothetical protein